MASKVRLSNAVRISDVNDFLAPSQACVLPLGGGAVPEGLNKNAVAQIKSEPAGSVLAPIVPVETTTTGTTKAKVTLSDCLTCSGCVTSAETVLLSTESLDAIRKVMIGGGGDRKNKYAVVALSQQAVASIAAHFGTGLEVTARKLSTFLRKDIGFDAVIDMSFARHLTLLEASAEFIERFKFGKKLTITSACPGWVSYAEKTQGPDILDCISSVRSPQGMLSLLSKALQPSGDSRQIWVSSIMPCHDKKLEASRREFVSQDDDGTETKDVDCVLTAGEVMDLIEERNFNFVNAVESPFNEAFCDSPTNKFGVGVGSGSGGYADFILRAAAKEFLDVVLPNGALPMEKASKSGDLTSITVKNKDGTKQLRFATAYGFRSLQSILRKMRRGQCMYDYIELMACPGGCNNGGGQLAAPIDSDETTRSFRQQANKYLEVVNMKFSEAPPVSDPLSLPGVRKLYSDTIQGPPGTAQARKMLSMSIQSRKTSSSPASLDW